jgi:hypothetical protein
VDERYMEERSILTAHIQALVEELRLAETKLGLPQIDANLHNRMQIRFGELIRNQQQALKYVQDEVDNDMPLDACWDSFQGTREKCQPILRECLALTQGALARSTGLDDRLCQIADFLLDGLSDLGLSGLNVEWGRFTILAEGEFFGEMAAVIRLRYPETSIWNLPVAAHEFGHFVIEETEVLRAGGEFENYVQQYQDVFPQMPEVEDERVRTYERERRRRFLHEYYADVFAVYTMGPAYAYTCLLLRFDPKTAYRDGEEHPSYEKRAHVILQTLEKMNAFQDSGYYSGIIEYLCSSWQRSVKAARPSGQSASNETLWRLEELVDELHVRLSERMPYARYSGWPRAFGLSRRLTDQNSTLASESEDNLRDVLAAAKLRDVLNAAWRCRINAQDGDQGGDDDVGRLAKALCKEIVTRPPQGPKRAAV